MKHLINLIVALFLMSYSASFAEEWQYGIYTSWIAPSGVREIPWSPQLLKSVDYKAKSLWTIEGKQYESETESELLNLLGFKDVPEKATELTIFRFLSKQGWHMVNCNIRHEKWKIGLDKGDLEGDAYIHECYFKKMVLQEN